MNTTISIIGCGWLGLPLGARLVAEGFQVKGTTTRQDKRPQLEQQGIQPYVLQLGAGFDGKWGDLLQSQVVIVAIPPSAHRGDPTLPLRQIVSAIDGRNCQQIIYTSSTAVYPNTGATVVEQDATYITSPHSGVVMLELEECIAENTTLPVTIVRPAGLVGAGRWPGKRAAGKRSSHGGRPMNIVHQQDVIDIFIKLVKQRITGETVSICSDAHPTRREFYQAVARHFQEEPPVFADNGKGDYKLVSNEKVKQLTGHAFQYDSLADFLVAMESEKP